MANDHERDRQGPSHGSRHPDPVRPDDALIPNPGDPYPGHPDPAYPSADHPLPGDSVQGELWRRDKGPPQPGNSAETPFPRPSLNSPANPMGDPSPGDENPRI